VPSAVYDVATINHGKAPTTKGYRYCTLLGANSQKVQYIAGATSPIQIIQQDKYAHVVSQTDHKVTGYVVFEPNVAFATGYMISSVRPVIAMIKDLNNGYIDVVVSDPDMNRVMASENNLPTPVTASFNLRGNFQLASGDTNATFTVLNGETTVSASCLNGNTYRYHLKNLSETAINNLNTIPLAVYPNPFQDKIVIRLNNSNDQLHATISDLNGILLISKDLSSISNEIDASSLNSGFYILKVNGANGIKSCKILKY
jgi:hypothetical protein